MVQAPYDPQTLNRYTYCRNNPIIYSDPSGHIFGIDDLLIIGIAAAYGGLKEGTHNFTRSGANFDWSAGLENAGKWATVAAAAVYTAEYFIAQSGPSAASHAAAGANGAGAGAGAGGAGAGGNGSVATMQVGSNGFTMSGDTARFLNVSYSESTTQFASVEGKLYMVGNTVANSFSWVNTAATLSQASQDVSVMGAALLVPTGISAATGFEAGAAFFGSGVVASGLMSAGADAGAAGCYLTDYLQTANTESLSSFYQSSSKVGGDLLLEPIGSAAENTLMNQGLSSGAANFIGESTTKILGNAYNLLIK